MVSFERITTQGRFVPQIDGLRFVAILSVTLFHIYASLNHNGAVLSADFGNTANTSILAKRGVELFFAISGFILAVPFASSQLRGTSSVDLKQYYLRRLTRLEPPYIINLLVWAGVLMIAQHQSAREVLPHLLASISYLHNLIYNSESTINLVAWSLEVEVQFYVLVPVLVGIFALADTRLRRCLIILLMLSSAILSNLLFYTRLQMTIAYYLPFFLAGFLLCDLYITRREWRRSFAWDVLAVCGWPLVWYFGRVWGHIVVPFLIVVLYLAAFRGRLCSAFFSNRVVTTIGGMCYSIYLFHFLIISSVGRVSKPLHVSNNFGLYFVLQGTVMCAGVLLFCGIFFLVVERPCMDRTWPRRLWNRLRSYARDSQTVAPQEAIHYVEGSKTGSV